MMQAGIFTGYFPYGLEETAKKIRAHNFNTVQLDLHFKDIDLSAGQITKDKAKKVRDVFRDQNLPVCCISGYTNIIHPDKTEREKADYRLSQPTCAACHRNFDAYGLVLDNFGLIGAYRAVLVEGRLPDPAGLAVVAIVAALLLWLGVAAYRTHA